MKGMFLIETIIELQKKLNDLKKTGTIGFVPTMGALHAGHISLVQQAVSENQVVVVSIFVNPTQFNDKTDLEKYPRNLNADLKLLEKTGCHFVFAPKTHEIYPEQDNRKFNFGDLETVMEGKFRPGHFNGVAQVVSKLFDIVQPDKAYFGLKDFQQLAIIKEMVAQLKLSVEIVACPIVREESGLAMSSRNELLTVDERKNAAVISQTLSEAQKLTGKKSVRELVDWVTQTINKNPYLTVEYVEIVDDRNLQPVKNWEENGRKVCCVAVFCGKIRLIDNVVFN
ncbi:MAG TPA: pantoate--beta-alanine ligase [Draconibacterium sp.]|nr:pantoate--beta-alanine ligase [Draconibacterium sp.]